MPGYRDTADLATVHDGLDEGIMTMVADEFVPIIEVPVSLAREADHALFLSALSEFATDDAQFRFTVEEGTHSFVIIGIDELQLHRKIETLRHIPGVVFQLGPPQIALRETITQSVEVDYTHKKVICHVGEFAHVKLVLDPPRFGHDDACDISIGTSNLLDKHVAGIRAVLLRGLRQGPLHGFPVIGVRVSLIDSAYHDVDSSATAFEIAAMAAVRDGLMKGLPVALEPIMKVVVVTPEDCTGAIIDDLKSRRGRVTERGTDAQGVIIAALVPAMNMFGYTNTLRALSKGRACYEVQFDHRAQVPLPDDPSFRPAVGMRA